MSTASLPRARAVRSPHWLQGIAASTDLAAAALAWLVARCQTRTPDGTRASRTGRNEQAGVPRACDHAGSAQSRSGRKPSMAPRPRVARGTGLVALSLAFSGCAHDTLPVSAEAAATIPTPVVGVNELPDHLLGLWHRDDPSGRAQCERYRAIPAATGGSDERSIAMIGSLVIAPRLIHEYAEYGEGAYNVVTSLAQVDDSTWRVEVEIGIDSMPSGHGDSDLDTYRLVLTQHRLGWSPWGRHVDSSPKYFRCDAVRSHL